VTQVPSRTDFEHLVIAESPDLDVLLTPDDEARCLFASGAGRALFGWEPASLEGHPFLDRVVLEDAPAVQRAFLRARTGELASASFRMECSDGSSRWCEVLVHTTQRSSPVRGIVGVVRDITARREIEAALTRQAECDPLTGAANRTVFRDRLAHALSRLARSERKVGVLFLDLDHFKAINDSMGHHVGDRILAATAQRLLAFLRPSDTLARLGGDEFAILLEDLTSSSAATGLAERIASAGHFPLSVGGEDVICTVSVGVVVTDDPHADVEELLESADRAMYRAKRRGREGYDVFDERLRGMALRRLATESMLRRALAEDRLVLEYQPILRLPDRTVVGAEALVRIRSGESELVLPEAFLDVANETGLVRRIDAWVMRNAVLQAEVWQTRGDLPQSLTVSMNLTARHLGDPGFADELADLVDEHSLAAGSLAIEVTEDDLGRLSPVALDSLQGLRQRGVKIVLDEFGIGPSSLTALRAMPLDLVKLHRTCIAELESSPRGRAVVAAVIALCHDLGLQVLAVGVETARQLEIVTELRCDQAQGFLWGASADPATVPPSEVAAHGGIAASAG
jgi:diguanylate cyclase (GGDEF)-like protein/PAS domain S-box-containing protein